MTSPLRREKEIETEEGVEMDGAKPLDAPRPPENSLPAPESEAQRDKPRLVRSEQAFPEQVETSSKDTTGAANAATEATSLFPREATSLFPRDELEQLQARWDQIQTSFVDQPRTSVHDAELLVSLAMQRMSDVFAGERSKLEQQWSAGSNASTEQLRVAFQRYRSFFRRVLSI
jgi:hypothetical protein